MKNSNPSVIPGYNSWQRGPFKTVRHPAKLSL